MWVASAVAAIVWFILKFLLPKSGWVHILLLIAISIAVVQLMTDRKTRYHKNPSGR